MNHTPENGRANAAQLLSLLTAQPQFDWRQYWFLLWRRKWWIILPTMLISCAGVVYALLMIRPIYEASAIVEVAPSRLNNRSVQSVTTGASAVVDYNELRRRILSTTALTELVERLDLAKDEKAIREARGLQPNVPALPFAELVNRVVIDHLRQRLAVTAIPSSQLFQISARHESPQTAYYLVRTLAEIFIDQAKRSELRGIRGIKEFSDEQLGIYETKVKDAEERLRQFKQGLASSQAQNVGLSRENIAKLQEVISSCEIAISDRQARVAQLERQWPAEDKNLLWQQDPDLLKIKNRLDEKLANFKKSAGRAALQDNYEITLNNDINLLRQESQRLLVNLIARLYPQLDAVTQQRMVSYQLDQLDLYILRARVAIANEVLNNFVRVAAAEPAAQLELQRLQDDLEQNRRVYKTFSDQARGSQIEEALQHSDAEFKYKIFEEARVPLYAVAGSKRKFVMICFAAGLACGLTLVFGREFLDQSIRTVEDVETSLQIPVWGIIPQISAPFNNWHRGLKKPVEVTEASLEAPTVN